MAENKPFVVNDRRKFTAEGELRPDVQLEPAPEQPKAEVAAPIEAEPSEAPVKDLPSASAELSQDAEADRADESLEPEDGTGYPPPPTADEIAQVNRAYEAMVDRLDTAIRSNNPGGDRMPAMTFERLVQSLYMQALMQLGGASEPGQQPQLDLIGARQTIDMLSIISGKTQGALNDSEDKLLQSALFELRMGFLEVTQVLARQAATRQTGGGQNPLAPGGVGGPKFGPGGGPSIVR